MNVLKKILFVINVCFLMLLNNCVQSTATLFGPAFTAAKTGSVYQAGLSYGSNSFLKKQLGKDPAVYVKDLFAQNFNQNKPTDIVKRKDPTDIVKRKDPTDIVKRKDPTDIVKRKDPTKSKKYTLISENVENDENDYAEFMMAVKKTLK